VPDESGRYFELKGKRAEEALHGLANNTFLDDWCYPNPFLPNGKELCDLLVVYDEIAIIFQVKNLKAREEGGYDESETEKNLRQLSGAKRQLFELKTSIELQNPRRGSEMFEPDKIKEVYLMSILMGEAEGTFSFAEELKTHTAHVMVGRSAEIIFSELDTISDFIEYFREKEKLFEEAEQIMITGGEEELLSVYLGHNRSFQRFFGSTGMFVDSGCWDNLVDKPEYQAKQKADEISYFWDGLIDRAHESHQYDYEVVAREMARLNRLSRRMVSKAFLEAQMRADSDIRHDLYRRKVVAGEMIFCFLFMDIGDDVEARQGRAEMLGMMCWVGRGQQVEITKVIGIATEKKICPTCTYDLCRYDIPEWTKVEQRKMDLFQREYGIFVDPAITETREQEYPSD
jgi:hypothetical protein